MKQLLKPFFIVALSVVLFSCSSRPLTSDREEDLSQFEDYDKLIVVESIETTEPEKRESPELAPSEPAQPPTAAPPPSPVAPKAPPKAAPKASAPKAAPVAKAPEKPIEQTVEDPAPPPQTSGPRQPELEDSEGFVGRRPLRDPFRVGERVTLSVSYFRVVAGTLDLEVLPFVQVNGEKSYHFRLMAKSNNFFSRIYSVEDTAETFVNFEDLRPYNMSMSIRESRQMKEIRSVHNWETMIVNYRERSLNRRGRESNRDFEWELLPYAQNVLSGTFYMRNFTLTPGKTIEYHVADRGKNIVVQIDVLRRETLKTDLGEFQTVVVQPRFEIDGVFRPTGDIFFWLTDDDRKLIVRFSADVRIGQVVGQVIGIEKGRP